nr:11456_t:CDS:2 [Entrophospora candida]
MSECIWKFICACIKLSEIPCAWREADIYPIPKLKEWECNLNNTQPITLLDTTHKAMVRLLNNCLAKIMVKHQILKGNQFAGLPSTSTFEPIRIINEIIEDAHEKNKEIWILFQDLSKAYDHVNIYMLEKALSHIKIPSSFCKPILSLFTNRKNQIFTEMGKTEAVFEIQQSCDLHKKICAHMIKFIKLQTMEINKQPISSLAFMDDTTWITGNQNNLEIILRIANDFYNLNNIQVNKEKSKLLMNIPGYKTEEVMLNFGQDTIQIKPAKYQEFVKILGVWVNLAGNRKLVFNQAKDEVLAICNTLKKKHITDKQLLYLNNMVIIPRIEYQTQVTILSQHDCNNIMAPFKKLFKHKIYLSSTVPNAILETILCLNIEICMKYNSKQKLQIFAFKLMTKTF